MANQEQLDILGKGVEVWNKWRREHQEIPVDLSGVDLSSLDLPMGNFSPARIPSSPINGIPVVSSVGGSLIQVNFSLTNLQNTDFNHADLRDAQFNAAYLSGANFCYANLSGANLSHANIHYTNFSWSNLASVNFTGAEIYWTTFSHTDLTQSNMSQTTMGWNIFVTSSLKTVKGLTTVQHEAPSSLDIYTLFLSHEGVPEIFLRGAGVPQNMLAYADALLSNPFQYYSCFISHSSRNEDFAKRLYADLQNNGVRCWLALEDLKIGDHYHQRIDESIRLYDKLVLILSEHAVQSVWVEREVVAAREKEDREQRPVLFPVRLDDAVTDTTKAWAADVRRRWHIGDFTQWKNHDAYQQAFERLLRDLKKADERPDEEMEQ